MSDSNHQKKTSLPRPQGLGPPGRRLPKPGSLQGTDSQIDGPTRTDEASSDARPAGNPSIGRPDRYSATVTSEGPEAAPTGQTVDDGRYQVLRLIARGGMGEVWLAQDLKLRKRYVAIKRLTAESLNNPKLRQRFEAEAESMARLTHQYVIRVFDIGCDSQGPFICMEYVSGPPATLADWPADLPAPPLTLQEYVERKVKLPLADAVTLLRQLCGAAMEAHALGIVHRDIKPANVLLDTKLSPRLIDFGLARDLQPEESQHTAAGAQMLTIGYGAPEQETDAGDADERADVYALGAVLWFLVSGQNPRFYRNSDAPPELKTILTSALMHDRAARTQTVADLDRALAVLQNGRRSAFGEDAEHSDGAGERLNQLSQCLEGERRAGVCPFCRHVHEPIPRSAKERQYCAGCGTSLWMKCGRCAAGKSTISLTKVRLIPIWERFCSKCGDDLLSPVVEHLSSAARAMAEAHSVVSADTNRAHQLAAAASESLECLVRQCGTDFSAGLVGQRCADAEKEIQGLRANATVKAAANEEDTWKAALVANSKEAFQNFLKSFPAGVHAEDAQQRVDVMTLADDIRNRLQAKAYETLLPDVGRLISMSTAAKQKWSDDKLSQLLKKDHSVESCMAYLKLYPEGKLSRQARAIVSPELRKMLLAKMSDPVARAEYLAFRSPAQQEEDEARAFNSTLWLWATVGLLIALPLGGYGLMNDEQAKVISGMVTAGGGLVWGILMSFLSSKRATQGPLPLLNYLLPFFALSKASPDQTPPESTSDTEPADVG
ncbi:MAG: serine/threonine-protein kinase [Planctomycetaceae bacterium]